MLRKAISYEGLDGNMETEEAYFHIYTNKLAELTFTKGAGYGAALQAMVSAGDQKGVYDAFKEIVSLSYGSRAPGGNKFVKASPAELAAFLDGPVFDALFMEIVTSETAALEFIMGILPKDMVESGEVKKAFAEVQLPAQNLHVPPMEELKFPPSGVTPDPVPAAYRRSSPIGPRDEVVIELPKELQELTREEILRAYDQALANKRDNPPPAA